MGIRLGEIQGLVVPGTVALGLVTSVTLRPEAERRRLGARRGGWGRWRALAILWRRWAVRWRGAHELGAIFGQDAVRGRGKGLLSAVHIWGWPKSSGFPYHLIEKTQLNFF